MAITQKVKQLENNWLVHQEARSLSIVNRKNLTNLTFSVRPLLHSAAQLLFKGIVAHVTTQIFSVKNYHLKSMCNCA